MGVSINDLDKINAKKHKSVTKIIGDTILFSTALSIIAIAVFLLLAFIVLCVDSFQR